MRKGNRILSENDVKHIETLLGKGLTAKSVAEILGVSQTSVSRVKTGTHFLQRKQVETVVEPVVEPVNETADVSVVAPVVAAHTGTADNTVCVPAVETLLKDVIHNQQTIIALLRAMLPV